jgi:hypothetical protein
VGRRADVFYKALGWLTWKAIRHYLDHKVPKGAVAAVVVVLGIAAVSAAARLRDTSSS